MKDPKNVMSDTFGKKSEKSENEFSWVISSLATDPFGYYDSFSFSSNVKTVKKSINSLFSFVMF